MTTSGDSLLDVQSTPDIRGIRLQQVGVRNVEIPLHILQKDGHTQMVTAKVSMSVGLDEAQKGTHLSRFIIQLSQHSQNKAFCYDLKAFLEETCQRLSSNEAYIEIDFRYFIDKKSPVTQMSAPMAYACKFKAALIGTTYQFTLCVDTIIATLCPCSKAISDYGAHNQRAVIRTKLDLNMEDEHEILWLEDLTAMLEECASCPVYPILKREDEKYVTERAYENPKFVEDVIREAIAVLHTIPAIEAYELEVEAFESIHSHNAWACQKETLKK